MAIYNVHAGHNFHVPGASGQFSETEQVRVVKNKVISMLKAEGNTVYDCTDEDGLTESQNLVNIVAKCNSHSVDLDISIHFNAFNSSAHGVEVYMYNNNTLEVSQRICDKIASLGFTNRGPRIWNALYVLRNTNSKAILIECCFCDSPIDAAIYNADKMAKAIVEGILGKTVLSTSNGNEEHSETPSKYYRIRKSWKDVKSQLGAYSNLENAKKNCPSGYTVYDWNGKVIYSNPGSISPDVNTKLYRVRKSWEDASSQIGAYSNLDNAKAACQPGYTVYDWKGEEVYVNAVIDKYYRIRLDWEDASSQIGAYSNLDNAKAACQPGYTVYDWNGKAVYSVPEVTPEDKLYRVRKSWNDATSQIGAYSNLDNAKKACTFGYSVYDWNGEEVYVNKAIDINSLKNMDNETYIQYIGTLAREDMKKTGILASITISQSILESGWGKTELATKVNNLFGMKANLSGNTWKSDWNGKKYGVYTKEEINGQMVTVLADFRAYNTIEESIKDHSDYLCGAMNGSKLRYAGLVGETNYEKAIQIIKNGGYATDSEYVDKIKKIIKRYDLTFWDSDRTPSDRNN